MILVNEFSSANMCCIIYNIDLKSVYLYVICTCSPLENLTLDGRLDRSIICSSEEEDAILDLVYSIKVQIVLQSSSIDDFFMHSHPVLWSFKKVVRFDFLILADCPSFKKHLSRHDHFFRVIFCV